MKTSRENLYVDAGTERVNSISPFMSSTSQTMNSGQTHDSWAVPPLPPIIFHIKKMYSNVETITLNTKLKAVFKTLICHWTQKFGLSRHFFYLFIQPLHSSALELNKKFFKVTKTASDSDFAFDRCKEQTTVHVQHCRKTYFQPPTRLVYLYNVGSLTVCRQIIKGFIIQSHAL